MNLKKKNLFISPLGGTFNNDYLAPEKFSKTNTFLYSKIVSNVEKPAKVDISAI